eukprot:CAMPEP_0170580610 /NCGR_PEP_ID=MMETSP0224-20130122/6599_1 /TAXON_ID=285029 /ORGANISM="Togula jolla, Strain CCCM 725" /LENGTH=72 /DNA_ID=CAMNT_0010903693 /DNA_START=644 /DNA_END=862 /DNA_ORIENTATION=+
MADEVVEASRVTLFNVLFPDMHEHTLSRKLLEERGHVAEDAGQVFLLVNKPTVNRQAVRMAAADVDETYASM